MWDFKSADAEAVKGRKNYILLVFKERLAMNELTPEMRTYVKLRLCIQYSDNIDKLTSRIRSGTMFIVMLRTEPLYKMLPNKINESVAATQTR